jgi:hypothetical protein
MQVRRQAIEQFGGFTSKPPSTLAQSLDRAPFASNAHSKRPLELYLDGMFVIVCNVAPTEHD